jgi:AcrR family transcriptional regulator
MDDLIDAIAGDESWLAAGIDATVRFDTLLEKKSRDRALGKRERTRFLVLSSVARQLLDNPAKRPTIEAVLEETGLSRGTFYNYFTDVDDCVVSLLSAFFKALWGHGSFSSPGGKSRPPESDPAYEANLWYCIAYETNAGLFAAFSQVSTNTPALLRMREQMNADWVDRVVAASSKRRGRPYQGEEKAAFKGELRLLIAMSIEALRERNVHRDPLLLKSFPDVESLARGLTAMWLRTISAYEIGSKTRD